MIFLTGIYRWISIVGEGGLLNQVGGEGGTRQRASPQFWLNSERANTLCFNCTVGFHVYGFYKEFVVKFIKTAQPHILRHTHAHFRTYAHTCINQNCLAGKYKHVIEKTFTDCRSSYFSPWGFLCFKIARELLVFCARFRCVLDWRRFAGDAAFLFARIDLASITWNISEQYSWSRLCVRAGVCVCAFSL